MFQLHNKVAKPAAARAQLLVPFTLKKKVIESVLNKVFGEHIDDGDFDFLNKKVVALNISDLKEQVYISFDNGLKVLRPQQYHVEISGSLDDFVTLALRKEDPDTLFFQRRICIQGETELGLAVKNLIDSVDLDELPRGIRKGLSFSERIYPYLMPEGAY